MTTPYGSNLQNFSVGSAPGTPTPDPSTPQFITQTHLGTPSQRGKAPKGTTTGAKRGRKPKNAATVANSPSIQQAFFQTAPPPGTSTSTQYTGNHYQPQLSWTGAGPSGSVRASSELPGGEAMGAQMMPPPPEAIHLAPQPILQGRPAPEDDIEGDDELLPAMADDDYSAQLSFQTQSKDNLKVLMDNFSSEQYDRFEAYRRHALPKQVVRKVIQQTLGHQVSMPVAQIIAGFSKVFVGEMVEKARAVQARRGETGPLSPDHMREAYRMYQEETGRVGAARPLRSKRLFVR
ncbi:TAFII28-domain-containing protein [Coprinellus micaceus]|uniref:Transcription initiation factor TFIID subunit 11 n=1 Tax=Coprinellus micaceus TaxID=71717 RepID=A0A4Y7SXV6_COPMI|nr:TAFII28-domain-containing protein [Coprinellus micaceus]